MSELGLGFKWTILHLLQLHSGGIQMNHVKMWVSKVTQDMPIRGFSG